MARKTTISREGLEFLIGAVKNTINIGDIINNEDLADNKTYSNIKIEERIDDKIDEKLANFADYQEKTDNTLTTTNKTIVGAINELKTGVSSISVPTKVSQLTNDSGYLSTEDITTTINSTSTDTQVASAKAVYDGLENINDFSVQVIKNNLNLNDITETGIYFFSRTYTPINTPTGANGWLLVMKGSYSDIVKQVWYSIDTADSNSYDTFERYTAGDTWSEWTKFLTEVDADGKYATITAADGKVDKDKIVTALDDTVTDEQVASAKAVYDELQELFQSVSSGKTLVANAITDKGISTATDATFATMATNISKINDGGYKEETVSYNNTSTSANRLVFTFSADVSGVKQITPPSNISSYIVPETVTSMFTINGKEVILYVNGSGTWKVTAFIKQ